MRLEDVGYQLERELLSAGSRSDIGSSLAEGDENFELAVGLERSISIMEKCIAGGVMLQQLTMGTRPREPPCLLEYPAAPFSLPRLPEWHARQSLSRSDLSKEVLVLEADSDAIFSRALARMLRAILGDRSCGRCNQSQKRNESTRKKKQQTRLLLIMKKHAMRRSGSVNRGLVARGLDTPTPPPKLQAGSAPTCAIVTVGGVQQIVGAQRSLITSAVELLVSRKERLRTARQGD